LNLVVRLCETIPTPALSEAEGSREASARVQPEGEAIWVGCKAEIATSFRMNPDFIGTRNDKCFCIEQFETKQHQIARPVEFSRIFGYYVVQNATKYL